MVQERGIYSCLYRYVVRHIENSLLYEKDYFGIVMEKYLNKKFPGIKFEVLNFGRSAFDIADIYAYQKTLVDKFNLDSILYMVSKEDLQPKYSDPLRPKTNIKNGTLIVSFNFAPSELEMYKEMNVLAKNSSILYMLNKGREKTKTIPLFAILLDKVYYWFNPKNIFTQKHIEQEEYQINPITKQIISSIDHNKIIIVNRGLEQLPWEFRQLCLDKGFKYIDLRKSLNLMKKMVMTQLNGR